MSAGKHQLFFSTRCRHCQAFMEALISTPFVREVTAICVDPSPTRPPLPPWLKSVPTLLVMGESAPRVGPGEVNNWLAERRIGAGTRTAASMMEDRRAPLTVPVYNPAEMAPRPDATARTSAPLRNTVVTSPAFTAPVVPTTYAPMPVAGGSSASAKLPAAISASTPATAAMAPPKLAGASEDGPAAYHGSEMGAGKWSDAYSFVSHTDYTAEKGYDPIVRNFELLGGPAPGGGSAAATTAAAAPKRSAKEDALIRDFEAYTASRDRDVAPPLMRRS